LYKRFFLSTGCEQTEWTEWGECLVTCDNGYQYRTRDFAVSTDVDKCTPIQNKTQSRACNLGKCKNIFLFSRLIVLDGLWFMVFNANFKQYFSYIVSVSFIGGGNRTKPPTCCKSLTNFIT
jgi:hypothetical protein